MRYQHIYINGYIPLVYHYVNLDIWAIFEVISLEELRLSPALRYENFNSVKPVFIYLKSSKAGINRARIKNDL